MDWASFTASTDASWWVSVDWPHDRTCIYEYCFGRRRVEKEGSVRMYVHVKHVYTHSVCTCGCMFVCVCLYVCMCV